MEKKESNKISFGLGLFLIVANGLHGCFKDYDNQVLIGLGLGVFLVIKHGFLRDTSNWKYSPSKIIGLCAGVIVVLMFSLYLMRPHDTESVLLTKEEAINLMVQDGQRQLPADLGNGDSVISVVALSANTLKYRYKIQIPVDSLNLFEVEEIYKKGFDERLKNLDNTTRTQWEKMELNFVHEFFDPQGNFAFKVTITPSDY